MRIGTAIENIRSNSEDYPLEFSFDLGLSQLHLERLPNIFSAFEANTKPIKLKVNFARYIPRAEHEAPLISPLLGLLRTRENLGCVKFAGRGGMQLSQRFVIDAIQNKSIEKLKFIGTDDMSPQLLSLIFDNSTGLKELIFDHVSTLRGDDASRFAMTRSLAENTKLEFLKFGYITDTGFVVTVLNALGRGTNNVKKLALGNPGIGPEVAALTTAVEAFLSFTPVEELRLENWDFTKAELCRSISFGASNRGTLTKLTFDEECWFDSSSVVFLKGLQVASIEVGDVRFTADFNLRTFLRSLLHTKSAVKHFSLLQGRGFSIGPEGVPFLVELSPRLDSLKFGSLMWIHRENDSQVSPVLDNIGSFKVRELGISDADPLPADYVESTLNELKNNFFIERLEIKQKPTWNRGYWTVGLQTPILSDVDRRRLEKFPAMNQQLRILKDNPDDIDASLLPLLVRELDQRAIDTSTIGPVYEAYRKLVPHRFENGVSGQERNLVDEGDDDEYDP